jgi:hypothetical protein
MSTQALITTYRPSTTMRPHSSPRMPKMRFLISLPWIELGGVDQIRGLMDGCTFYTYTYVCIHIKTDQVKVAPKRPTTAWMASVERDSVSSSVPSRS